MEVQKLEGVLGKSYKNRKAPYQHLPEEPFEELLWQCLKRSEVFLKIFAGVSPQENVQLNT